MTIAIKQSVLKNNSMQAVNILILLYLLPLLPYIFSPKRPPNPATIVKHAHTDTCVHMNKRSLSSFSVHRSIQNRIGCATICTGKLYMYGCYIHLLQLHKEGSYKITRQALVVWYFIEV